MPEFAPGIEDRNVYGDLNTLPLSDVATMVRQKHLADRARLHEDLRIGTPSGMFSWAVPKFLPTGDEKRLAIRQPLHSWSYNDFQGRLKHGYGKGTVSKMEQSPVVILKRSPSHVMFTRGDSKDAPIYNLVQTSGKNWLLSIKKPDQPMEIRRYTKEHFKSMPIEAVAQLVSRGASITPKIDGAGALAYLGPKGISVYSIRSDKNNLKPEYTDIIGNLRGAPVPEDLQGTTLRGELYGLRGNNIIPPQELSGLLNSTLMNATNKRKAEGLQLMLAALAVHDKGVDQYDQQRVNRIVERLNNPAILPMTAYRNKNALDLLHSIMERRNKLTTEGVVVHQPGQRPIKAKNVDDADVYVKDVFKADTKSDNRAGGFSYSLSPGGPAVGRVGTGFDYKTLRDMLRNPEAYIGRTARIKNRGQYNDGAYRAPSFIAMKED